VPLNFSQLHSLTLQTVEKLNASEGSDSKYTITLMLICPVNIFCIVVYFVGLLLVSLFQTVVLYILSVVFLGDNCNAEAYSLQYV